MWSTTIYLTHLSTPHYNKHNTAEAVCSTLHEHPSLHTLQSDIIPNDTHALSLARHYTQIVAVLMFAAFLQ